MTWDNFKEYVDKRLAKAGFSGNTELNEIDVSYNTLTYDEPIVVQDENGISVF